MNIFLWVVAFISGGGIALHIISRSRDGKPLNWGGLTGCIVAFVLSILVLMMPR
jgi:hypothetical protein